MEQVPSQICVFLKLPPRLELLCRGFLISSPQADVCSGKLGDFILTARHLLSSSYWTELIWRLPIILFLKKKKKSHFKYVCVWGESLLCVRCWIVELGLGWRGILVPADSGVALLLNSAFKAVPRSGLLRLPANHSQTLAPEAWKDECFACWNKRDVAWSS